MNTPTITTANPFPMPIHLPTLRRHLFNGSDRIPQNREETGHYNVTAYDWRREPLGAFHFRVLPAESFAERTLKGVRGKPHRILVECPVCKKWIPAGRANQHGRIHVSA